jgi:hypothetical protein
MMKEKHGAINTLNLKLHLKFDVQLIKLMEFFLTLHSLHRNPSIMYISSVKQPFCTNRIPMQYPLKLIQFILSFQVKTTF